MARRLPARFYARDTLLVARELLGKVVRHGDVALAITEVEAYLPGDTAAHSRHGRTARNAPLWGPPGRAYVYLCYGLHQMLNLVTAPDGVPAAVLIRACRPVAGEERVRARRGASAGGPALLTGPGKVGQALALDGSFNHQALHRAGGLEVVDGPPPRRVLTGARVGIAYAHPADVEAPWRFAEADSPWVSHRAGLAPLG